MIIFLLKSTIESQLIRINWSYVSPNIGLIERENEFVFRNPNGNEVKFGFDEICHWLYDEDYIGCGHDCEKCLTPIC